MRLDSRPNKWGINFPMQYRGKKQTCYPLKKFVNLQTLLTASDA